MTGHLVLWTLTYGIVTNIAGVDLVVVECQDDHIWVEAGHC